ncbi:MAG: DoxX family protein [Thermoplasmata archaeon]|nr:DoxX family protein [Thermoplasmata archaeon]
MVEPSTVGHGAENWWARNARSLKSLFRIAFGLVWLVDGALKFTSGFVNSFPAAVQTAAGNAPSWLSGWYSFWVTQANGNPSLIVYTVGILELALGIAVVAGLLRKVAYVAGVALSLLIWAVPEGFGGPYSPGAGGTDVGAGVIYALLFLALIVFNSVYGVSRYSLDYYIEGRFPSWARLAEFSPWSTRPRNDVPRLSAASESNSSAGVG